MTTIISRFKDSGALIYWAWTQGREGKDFRETTKAAADAGTIAHAMVEADLKATHDLAEDWHDPDVVGKAQDAFKAFKSWKRQSRLKVISLECPLTSETHMFGGTPDGIVADRGEARDRGHQDLERGLP